MYIYITVHQNTEENSFDPFHSLTVGTRRRGVASSIILLLHACNWRECKTDGVKSIVKRGL
jgi:hypothetical protein